MLLNINQELFGYSSESTSMRYDEGKIHVTTTTYKKITILTGTCIVF